MRHATGLLLLVASTAAYRLQSVRHVSTHAHLACNTRHHPPRAEDPLSRLYRSPPVPAPTMSPPPVLLADEALALAPPAAPGAADSTDSRASGSPFLFVNPFAAGGFLSSSSAPAHPALTPEEARLAALREKASFDLRLMQPQPPLVSPFPTPP